MSDQLLPLPLTERSVHLCVDMQRIFSAEGPWPTPWMDKVLPVTAALASRHPEKCPQRVRLRTNGLPATWAGRVSIRTLYLRNHRACAGRSMTD